MIAPLTPVRLTPASPAEAHARARGHRVALSPDARTEHVARILRLRREGLSLSEIARRIGVHHCTVAHHLRSNGVALPHETVRARADEIARMHLDRVPVTEIARRLGISRKTVAYHLDKPRAR